MQDVRVKLNGRIAVVDDFRFRGEDLDVNCAYYEDGKQEELTEDEVGQLSDAYYHVLWVAWCDRWL